MKKVSIFLFSLGLILTACNQKKDIVDEVVISERVKLLLDAKNIDPSQMEWEKDADHYYGEYEKDHMELELKIDQEGNLIESITEIDPDDLDNPISRYVATNHFDFVIEEAEIVENQNGIFYYLELEKGNEQLELIFDEQGTFLSMNNEEDVEMEHKE